MKHWKCYSAASFEMAGLIALALLALVTAAGAEEVRIERAILAPLRTIEVPAPEAGLLVKIKLHEGQKLKVNQVVGYVDPREQELLANIARQDLTLAVKEGESNVRVRLAEKERRVAQAELARAEGVNAQLANTVSLKEVDRLKLAVERAALAVEHAEFEQMLVKLKIGRIKADLRLAEDRVRRLRIVCPISGVVSKVHKHAGEWADKGEEVARVVTVDRLKLEGYVPVEAALSGLVGREVRVTCSLPKLGVTEAAGRVVFISPEAEPIDSQVRFWAEVDNRQLKLRPGLSASVVITDKRVAPPGAPGEPLVKKQD